MTITELTALTESEQKTAEEKLRILKKARAAMMEELHGKQRLVDQIDYMIYELQTARKKENARGGI
ncbi:MAG: hypothetical protein LUG65_06895 [Clostridiales bacterium]|nr:hypothetical protein [Clostridiales bacterium]